MYECMYVLPCAGKGVDPPCNHAYIHQPLTNPLPSNGRPQRAKVEDKARAMASADLKRACDLLGACVGCGGLGGRGLAGGRGGHAHARTPGWTMVRVSIYPFTNYHYCVAITIGVNRSGKTTKEELVGALVDWLEAPEDVGGEHKARFTYDMHDACAAVVKGMAMTCEKWTQPTQTDLLSLACSYPIFFSPHRRPRRRRSGRRRRRSWPRRRRRRRRRGRWVCVGCGGWFDRDVCVEGWW